VSAGILLLAAIGYTAYLLTKEDRAHTAKPGIESPGSRAVTGDKGRNAKPAEPAPLLKDTSRGTGLIEGRQPRTPLPSAGPAPQKSSPAAAPSLPPPAYRPEQPAAIHRAPPLQKRENAESSPQLPAEWSDSPPSNRIPLKKTPAPRPGSGEVAVVLSAPDPLAAGKEIEAAVTSLGGRITGRAYSGGNDILYTRIEVEKLIELMGRLGKVGKMQELPDLPPNAEGTIDLVIKW
jgi:hypothetical protein